MIGRIRGIIIEKQPPLILLEIYGIGISYEVYMPITSFDGLPGIGQEVTLYTHCIVREDIKILFGFFKKNEIILFRELIKVNGVGPKLALAIISGMSEKEFYSAVANNEINTLIKLPGVGKKTAERLLVEMKDRFKNTYKTFLSIGELPDFTDNKKEAIAALISLGYTYNNASQMVNKVAQSSIGSNCETLIIKALRTTILGEND
ncbi:Holliday junction branch migration protein RuvA [Candidatus Palibaumannia cicadellinicola]|uniref:Holliday junction branch migration complex subunit RuvA n=1 Tax=Candidatus Palibaumannia cicadellinicola TaxID=186490 RepID=A0A0K2BKY0_9GAMM|nr:Holliday junction branch migration protein RuvA [Candidatus Baumannia cicadellinicola]AKZ65859.1 Holliday junction DNA helicase [Candidatus Baumannia cicadellinicola]